MWSKAFWIATAERAIKTTAQFLVALIGTNAADITSLDWQYLLGVSATAGVLSVLTSVGSSAFGNPGPSLADETLTSPTNKENHG